MNPTGANALASGLARSIRRVVYVGSFDPITLGHTDLIERGAAIFDHLTVGVGINPDKAPLFSSAERLAIIREATAHLGNVTIEAFEGLAVDFVRRCGAHVMLRGVRTLMDIDAEFTMTLANRALDPGIDTLFLMASERYTHISSSLIRQIALLGGPNVAQKLADFVPSAVVGPLLKKFDKKAPA